MLEENTYLYLTSLPLLYLYLCWGKNNFPPFPSSISTFVFRRLIDQFFKIKYFVSFLPAGTLMFIRLLMYPVQMPSLMNLIFAEKHRIMFFDPPGGRVGRNFFTLIVLDSPNHLASFLGLLCKTGLFLLRRHNLFFSPNCLAHFYTISTQQHFPPQKNEFHLQ